MSSVAANCLIDRFQFFSQHVQFLGYTFYSISCLKWLAKKFASFSVVQDNLRLLIQGYFTDSYVEYSLTYQTFIYNN